MTTLLTTDPTRGLRRAHRKGADLTLRMMRTAHPTAMGVQNGYILLPVVLLITLISVVAFLLNHESALGTDMTGSLNEARRAESVAQAGLQHAIWGVQNSACAGDLTLPSIPFGAASYQASVASATTTTTYTINVDQDAWLKESSPGENHGTDSELSAKAASGDAMRALYRFDLSAIPASAQIGSATAWFYVTANDDKGAVNIHEITATWTEAATTWTTTGDQFNSQVIASIPTQVSSGVWVQVNLTTLVQSWVNGSSNNGIMLVASSDAAESKYTSREWSPANERPWLQVVATSGPASPVTVSATGTLASGVARTLKRVDVTAYQPLSSLTWQPGAELQDAFIWDGAHKFKNFGVSPILNIKNDRNVLIRFALQALPPGARVTDARLGLYLEDGKDVVDGVLDLHRISRSWVEGIHDDADPAGGEGVTYEEYDGGSYWTTRGGDYDATVIDSVTLPSMVPGWYEWNVTGQIQAWLDGAPNYGFLLREGGGDAGDIDFTSSDNTSNPENRPRLMLTFACECGIACQIPQGSGNILMVVSNEWFMTDDEKKKKALFESWGYTVDLISQWDVSWNFDAKAVNKDVVYVSEAVDSTTWGMAPKLAATTLGVINEEGAFNDELGIAAGLAWPVGNSITITDTSHYINQPFAAGSLPIFSAAMEGLTVSGSEAGGLQTLADWGTAGSLVVLETGAALQGGGSAPGRRVMLPLGRDQNFNPDYLNNNGRLIVQRALQWASSVDNNPNSGHWLLDDGAGTLATDSSGRGNDGTLTNGPLWVAGVLGDALDFDGINDRVLVPDAPSLDITDNITLAAWIRPNKTGTQYVIRKAQFDSTDGYELSLSTTGKVFFRLNQDTNANTYRIDSTTSYPNNGSTWMHIAATYDGSVMRLYLDGVEEASLNAAISIATNDSDLSIGAQVDGSRGIDGVIDDVWVYGQAMSATEIADLAAENPMGPLAHWKLDETAGTLAVDSEGGHDGALLNGPTWTTGQDGGALDLDGANDSVRVPHDDALSLTETMTFTAWINPDKIGIGYNTVLAKDGGGGGSNYYFGIWQDELVFGFFSGGTFREVFTSGLNLKTDTWQHVAASFDNSANRVLLYLDGVAVHKGEMTFSPTAVSADLAIGRSPDGELWNGQLDDVRIYDRVLDEAGIAEITKAGGGGGGGPSIEPPGGCNGTFRDEFNLQQYDQNDGSLKWATNWAETGETTSPTGGDIRITSENDTYELTVRDDGQTVWREADLSQAGAATLSFDYWRRDLIGSADYVAVEVSYNGGSSWTELDRFTGTADDGAFTSTSYVLDAGSLSANTRIRFLTPGSGMSNSNQVLFDNIQIECKP